MQQLNRFFQHLKRLPPDRERFFTKVCWNYDDTVLRWTMLSFLHRLSDQERTIRNLASNCLTQGTRYEYIKMSYQNISVEDENEVLITDDVKVNTFDNPCFESTFVVTCHYNNNDGELIQGEFLIKIKFS